MCISAGLCDFSTNPSVWLRFINTITVKVFCSSRFVNGTGTGTWLKVLIVSVIDFEDNVSVCNGSLYFPCSDASLVHLSLSLSYASVLVTRGSRRNLIREVVTWLTLLEVKSRATR